jgi:hypothetical protein
MDESEVVALFRERVEPDKGFVRVFASQHGTDFFIEPANSKAARMTFNPAPDGGEIAGTLGVNTPVEISQHGSRYSTSIGFDELRSIVLAVVARGFSRPSGLSSDTWFDRGRQSRSRARSTRSRLT